MIFIIALTVEARRSSSTPPRASETSFVVASDIPEVASVSANPYTLEMSVKSPMATAPILLFI
ncbi:MAG: hypothetical protein IIX30_02500 [Clostridia bacterium]|nr:hypothetical protein [Clostridia bacterium]